MWTWGWEGSAGLPPGSTTVEVTLTPDGDATVVHLRHSSLPDEDARDNHRKGWAHYTARLAVAAAGGDPGPDALRVVTPNRAARKSAGSVNRRGRSTL